MTNSRALALARSRKLHLLLRGTRYIVWLQPMSKRRLLHCVGSTIRLSRGVGDLGTVPVLVPRMVCFCFRRNKVSPTKRIELPDISAIPESSAAPESSAISGSSADAGSSGVSGDSAAPDSSAAAEGSPAGFGSAAAEQGSAGTKGPAEEGGGSASYAIHGISASFAQNSRSVTADGAATQTAVSEAAQKPDSQESPSSTDLSDIPEFTKHTFGRFDVYFARNDDADSDVTSASGRPLVILIPWLNARWRHVHKYSSLYLEKGMDVLYMPMTPMQIVRPRRTKEVIHQLLDLLKQKEGFLADRPLIIHGFSIGAFVWGQILVEMGTANDVGDNDGTNVRGSSISGDSVTAADTTMDVNENSLPRDSDQANVDDAATGDSASADQSGANTDEAAKDPNSTWSKYRDVHQRIIGLVMDSPAPVEAMLEGIPYSISTNTVVRAAIRTFLSSYFRLFPRSVAAHYLQGEQAAEENPMRLPVLMLYSSADTIAPVRKLDAVVEGWERSGVIVHARKWDDSPHVSHFRCHPEQYKEELHRFLHRLCLTQGQK